MPYSIIIPIYNESKTLETLLESLKKYYNKGHEIIIVNDGSTDNSNIILFKHNFITLINLKKNSGKGVAIRVGLLLSRYNKIIIYDGDLELDIENIKDLMKLDKKKVSSIMGIRSKYFNPLKSGSEWGNFIFTIFFNFLHMTTHKDILCCAKSFYKKDIPLNRLKSSGFDIDIELSTFLTRINKGRDIKQILIGYRRRSIIEGKKLKISDGWTILMRVIKSL